MMLNRCDLNTIQGLLVHVDQVMRDTDLDAAVVIHDSNGDKMGEITLMDDEYQFVPEGGA